MSKPVKEKPAPRASGAAPRFEAELARLEKIVERLEGGQAGLEEALASFEEGIGLTRALMKRLDEAEKRIEVLLDREKGSSRRIAAEDLERMARGEAPSSGDEEDEEDLEESDED